MVWCGMNILRKEIQMAKKYGVYWGVLFSWMILFSPGSGICHTIDEVSAAASEKIAKGLKDKGYHRVAVTGIVDSRGKANGLTTYVQEVIAGHLNRLGISVPERSRQEQVAKENSLQLLPGFDEQSGVELGQALNADAVVAGTLTRLAEDFVLQTRVVGCASGIQVPGTAFKGKLTGSKDTAGLFSQNTGLTVAGYFSSGVVSGMVGEVYVDDRFLGRVSPENHVLNVPDISPGVHQVTVSTNNGVTLEQEVTVRDLTSGILNFRLFKPLKLKFWQEEDGSERVIGDGGEVFSGKRYRFCVQANQDCHVYIFNQGTSGKFFPLVPNEKLRTGNFIKAHQSKMIPAKGQNGFNLKGLTGEEKIYVIGSLVPIENLDEAAKKLTGQSITVPGFSKVIHQEKSIGYTKDYGFDEGHPAVSESVSLDPLDPVVMVLRYEHK